MSVSSEILAIQNARNSIRDTMVTWGKAQSADKLATLAESLATVQNKGAVSVDVKEGESYTIPEGYHNGSGTVRGVAGGGNYTLQAKSVTPTTSQQPVTPDEGYYGLSGVTVAAIPENYRDISSTTATPTDVLATKVFIQSDGEQVAGTMVNNGAVSGSVGVGGTYTIPAGYHNGEGTVTGPTLTLQEKTVTPSMDVQEVTPDSGYDGLSKVTVNAGAVIADTTAVAADVLSGKIFHVADGSKATGTMANNGAVSATINVYTASNLSYTVPSGYHNGTGTVTADASDLIVALQEI